MLKLVSDPAISQKISKMQQRVQWQNSLLVARGIDQTRMVIEDRQADAPEFSFLVVGDTGAGNHRGYNPQRQVAELMLPHHQECRFMLHTGDVIYLVGSSEYYQNNFIKPYREFLLGGEHPQRLAYDQMVFKLAILPVLGNHDYYDLPPLSNLLSLTTLPLRRLLRAQLDIDVGWHGSRQGDAYARAFLDYLKALKLPGELARHLDKHYTAKTDTGYCLCYQPGYFTRLPNRYYTFRYGGIDFFALDSNTFNDPLPLATGKAGEAQRRLLEQRRDDFERQKLQILETSATLNPNVVNEAEQLNDLRVKLSQIEELIVDIEKQLATDENTVTDIAQLDWLKQRLIASWNNSQVRGRILYFHHPPYVTEATKWQQAQTLAVRQRLREVLDQVAQTIGPLPPGRAIVDLVLNGHAHCLEHLETLDTGHADSYVHWIVCGGSGYSLRRQRQEGRDLMEICESGAKEERLVARSKLFIGRNGHGSQKRRPYSCLRINVKDGVPPKFIVQSLIAERYQHQWYNYEPEPFVI